MSTVSEMVEKIEADNVKFLRLQFADIQGMPKNVAIPVQQAEKALSEGIWFDGSSIEGFARIEESDMLLKPDPATYAILPWRPAEARVARFICDVYTYENKPFEGDPRYVLKRQCEQAKKMGFTFNTGPELEFFLFKMVDGRPSTNYQDYGGYFDLAPTDAAEDVRREIVFALTQMGFEIEASHHEVAESQHEIDFKYSDALDTADKVITFKFATKTLALAKNLHATFMAKPIAGINGSGMHTHGSLSHNGKNAFYDPDAKDGLSDIAMYYIGGILAHARQLRESPTRPLTRTSVSSPGTKLRSISLGVPLTGLHSSGYPLPAVTALVPSYGVRTRCATHISALLRCSLRVSMVSRRRSSLQRVPM